MAHQILSRCARVRTQGQSENKTLQFAKEITMRRSDPSPHLRGVPAAARITTLVACFCAVLALSSASSHAQSKLDFQKLFAEHLRTAHGATLITTSRVAAVSTRDTDAAPIPGGLAPGVHIFAPGPPPIGQGVDVELNGITNFRGFSALGYLGGTATDSNGNNYVVGTDMRVFQGEYVSADGSHHRGTFVFI